MHTVNVWKMSTLFLVVNSERSSAETPPQSFSYILAIFYTLKMGMPYLAVIIPCFYIDINNIHFNTIHLSVHRIKPLVIIHLKLFISKRIY